MRHELGWTIRRSWTRWRRRRAPRLMVTVAVVMSAMAGANVARAQMATVQYQSTYPAYNVWGPRANKCNETEKIYGSEPAAPGQYPVLIYLHGLLSDWWGNVEGQKVVQAAAAEGWEAAAFTYDSVLTGSPAGVDGDANCMFSPSVASNPISQICARAEADCSNGFVVAGFSLGGAIAGRAQNFNPQVRAAWVMGVSEPIGTEGEAAPAGTRVLPNDKLRIDVGQLDVQQTSGGQTTFNLNGLNELTGQSCTTFSCLNADGSGYYVVSNSEVADGVADHCYWQRVNKFSPANSCTANASLLTFDPGFAPPSTTPWSLITSLDWLHAQLG